MGLVFITALIAFSILIYTIFCVVNMPDEPLWFIWFVIGVVFAFLTYALWTEESKNDALLMKNIKNSGVVYYHGIKTKALDYDSSEDLVKVFVGGDTIWIRFDDLKSNKEYN